MIVEVKLLRKPFLRPDQHSKAVNKSIYSEMPRVIACVRVFWILQRNAAVDLVVDWKWKLTASKFCVVDYGLLPTVSQHFRFRSYSWNVLISKSVVGLLQLLAANTTLTFLMFVFALKLSEISSASQHKHPSPSTDQENWTQVQLAQSKGLDVCWFHVIAILLDWLCPTACAYLNLRWVNSGNK